MRVTDAGHADTPCLAHDFISDSSVPAPCTARADIRFSRLRLSTFGKLGRSGYVEFLVGWKTSAQSQQPSQNWKKTC